MGAGFLAADVVHEGDGAHAAAGGETARERAAAGADRAGQIGNPEAAGQVGPGPLLGSGEQWIAGHHRADETAIGLGTRVVEKEVAGSEVGDLEAGKAGDKGEHRLALGECGTAGDEGAILDEEGVGVEERRGRAAGKHGGEEPGGGAAAALQEAGGGEEQNAGAGGEDEGATGMSPAEEGQPGGGGGGGQKGVDRGFVGKALAGDDEGVEIVWHVGRGGGGKLEGCRATQRLGDAVGGLRHVVAEREACGERGAGVGDEEAVHGEIRTKLVDPDTVARRAAGARRWPEVPMTFLTLLLMFKIAFTALFAALPMLLLPGASVQARIGVDAAALPYIRLYGWALIALLTGYASGIFAAEAGVMPWGIVVMGLVSNGGAALLMLTPYARLRSAGMAAVFGLIALGLGAALVWPEAALTRAW